MTFDPIREDAPRDPEYPASMAGLVFESDGAALNGIIYTAAGAGPHPLIVLLHGFPGHERNFDLAQILRRAGWHVVVFHYRGSWGSEGVYTFGNVLADTEAVLAQLQREPFATQYRIQTDKIITIGHSLGGWVALMAANKGWVTATASLAGVNFGVWIDLLRDEPDIARPMLLDLFENSRVPLHGMDSTGLIDELLANQADWDLVTNAARSTSARMLLVGAKRDQVVSVFDHHIPLVNAYKGNDVTQLTQHLLDADHAFSDTRIQLAQVILDWLHQI